MVPLRDADGLLLANADQVLRRSHQRVARVSVLDDLFNPLPGLVFTGELGYAVDGAVTQDTARAIRRTLSLTLANPDGVWTPRGEGSPFYWDRHVFVERGVRVGGVEYYSPQGVFLIDTPSVDSRARALTISGSDRMDRATRSEFTAPTTYDLGDPVGEVIRDILEDAGVGSSRWTVNDEGAQLGADRYYEAGEDRMGAALSLATAFALEVFADANGFMVVQPVRDPESLASTFTFASGESATMLGLSKKWSRDRFYNHVLVTGESSELDPPARAEVSVTDPSNPLRVTGPMGDRLYKYVSAMITTDAQALAVAQALLWEKALIEEEISVEHIVNPTIEAGDAVTVVEADSATDDRYAVTAVSSPLGAGPATLTVKKVRRLS